MKQKVFIDTNVMIDLLAKREPFYKAAKHLFSLVDTGKCIAVLAPISFKSLATTSRFRDIEDAMQHYAAVQAECDCIVTRNVKDFQNSDIPIYLPDDYLKLERK